MWLLLSMAASLSCGSRLAAPHRALWLGCDYHMGEGIVESPPSPPVWLNHTVISLRLSVQTLACVWTAVMRTNTEGPNGAPMMTIFFYIYIYIWCINKKIHIWMYIKMIWRSIFETTVVPRRQSAVRRIVTAVKSWRWCFKRCRASWPRRLCLRTKFW